jgi:hypothetical protein
VINGDLHSLFNKHLSRFLLYELYQVIDDIPRSLCGAVLGESVSDAKSLRRIAPWAIRLPVPCSIDQFRQGELERSEKLRQQVERIRYRRLQCRGLLLHVWGQRPKWGVIYDGPAVQLTLDLMWDESLSAEGEITRRRYARRRLGAEVTQERLAI